MQGRRIVVAMLVGAGLLEAQQPSGAACAIEQRKPFQVNGSWIYIDQFLKSSRDDEKEKHLRSSVGVLTKSAERIDASNPVGRAYLLGKTLIFFRARIIGMTDLTTRGRLGFEDRTEEKVDLLHMIDSVFSVVEQKMPMCSDSTNLYRGQVGLPAMNAAITAFGKQQYDAAIADAQRSLRIMGSDPRSSSALQVLAQSYQAKNDLPAAISTYERTLANPRIDPKVRAQLTFNLGVLSMQRANALAGDEKKAAVKAASTIFEKYIRDFPEGADIVNARAAYARALQDAGETGAVASLFKEMLENPAKYPAGQLFEAGGASAASKQWKDAATLFEAGLVQSPYNRDALYNLSNVYFASDQPDKMAPIVERLAAIDPLSADSWKLRRMVVQERKKFEKDAKKAAALTDSIIAMVGLEQKAPVRVEVQDFQRRGRTEAWSWNGTVTNLGAAPASWTLTVEFLAKDGKVVATATDKVDALAAKGAKPVALVGTGAGIIGWRYTLK
ncbi:MAG: hypothetical protein K2X99_01215 [Gemmatimonadaceae bacterium]|nr:hypothetical protein [Gemmatimonadaceae bacterium]